MCVKQFGKVIVKNKMFSQNLSHLLHALVVCLVMSLLLFSTNGCRNPAQSQLPPSAISPQGTPMPVLATGDVYADEVELDQDRLIQVGDLLDIIIRRGGGEEKHTALVHKTGRTSVSFVQVDVLGITAAKAADRIQEKVSPYIRNPFVQVHVKRNKLRVKRVFVFGAVNKPGMYPMTRQMTVMEAVATAENYKETALLEEIRIIRGNLERPQVLSADLSRLFTYGDASFNLALAENDVVFVPREPMGDAVEAAKKLTPIIQVALAPFQAAFFGKTLVQP